MRLENANEVRDIVKIYTVTDGELLVRMSPGKFELKKDKIFARLIYKQFFRMYLWQSKLVIGYLICLIFH